MTAHTLSERWRIHITRVIGIVFVLFVFIVSSKWEEISFISSIFFLVGCIMVGIASLGRLWCSLYIAGYKNSILVNLGPYSISRNPLYFFSMIGGVGVGLTTETILIPAAIFVLFIMCYPLVIRDEERRLLTLHGEALESYRSKVPIFIPKLSLLNEPDTYTVNPKIFKKNIFGALWFVWLIGILEIIEELHEMNIIPTYFNIY